MNSNIDEISKASEQAATGISTTVESSDELSRLAETLKQKVSQFHI